MKRFLGIGLILLLVLWAASFVWVYGSRALAEKFPLWAWREGTPEMQQVAAPSLVNQVEIGDPIEDAISLLGPGSKGWPQQYRDELAQDGALSFAVRSTSNRGIIVHFRSGRVKSVSIYD